MPVRVYEVEITEEAEALLSSWPLPVQRELRRKLEMLASFPIRADAPLHTEIRSEEAHALAVDFDAARGCLIARPR